MPLTAVRSHQIARSKSTTNDASSVVRKDINDMSAPKSLKVNAVDPLVPAPGLQAVTRDQSVATHTAE